MSENKNSDSSQEPKNQILKDEEALLLDHNYDGIQELDHPLPNWWVWTFYLSIIFSVFYVGYYMTGIGPTLTEELNVALAKIEAQKETFAAQNAAAADDGSGASPDEIVLASFRDQNRLKNGASVYTGKCAACHGDKGQGLIGPNLVDDHWVHGTGRPSEVAAVIRDGIPAKGMPPWGGILTQPELADVTAYIRSIRGTNPPGAKPPEGELHAFQEL